MPHTLDQTSQIIGQSRTKGLLNVGVNYPTPSRRGRCSPFIIIGDDLCPHIGTQKFLLGRRLIEFAATPARVTTGKRSGTEIWSGTPSERARTLPFSSRDAQRRRTMG